MRINWKCFMVVLIIALTVIAMSSMTAFAARGGARGPAVHQGGSQGMVGGARQSGGGGAAHMPVTGQGGPQGAIGGARHAGGGVVRTGGAGQVGQFAGGGMGRAGQGQVRTGTERGIEGRGMGERTFNRGTFFGGRDHDWWRQNREHRFWNGNAWVFGVEPVGFVAVPVPVSSCPYSPEMYGGDPNACFFGCVDNGYDPVSVCNICCGTNY